MRILVTGKNGQLGRSIQKLVSAKCEKNRNKFFDNFIFVGRNELDLGQNDSITDYFQDNKFDLIINCAAYTAVNKAEDDVEQADLINHIAVKSLAIIAHQQGAKLIHISTDYVFDGKSDKPYVETDIPNPLNAYGKTKLAGEKAIQKSMLTDAIIIRTSWVYSEYGNNFVKTMLRLGRKSEDLYVVSDQIGSPTYATDLASVILKIINNKKFINNKSKTQIYHYSNKGQISWYDFSKNILKDGKRCKLFSINTSERGDEIKRPMFTSLDTNKIENEFGITIPNWEESLKNSKITIT